MQIVLPDFQKIPLKIGKNTISSEKFLFFLGKVLFSSLRNSPGGPHSSPPTKPFGSAPASPGIPDRFADAHRTTRLQASIGLTSCCRLCVGLCVCVCVCVCASAHSCELYRVARPRKVQYKRRICVALFMAALLSRCGHYIFAL